jgi:hypothetical protein
MISAVYSAGVSSDCHLIDMATQRKPTEGSREPADNEKVKRRRQALFVMGSNLVHSIPCMTIKNMERLGMQCGCWLVAVLKECGAYMSRDVWNASLSNFDTPESRYLNDDKI